MKITGALIDKLIRLRDGETLPATSLKGAWVEELLRDGVIISRSHGSKRTLSIADKSVFLQALSHLEEGLGNLEQMKALVAKELSSSESLRAEQAANTGNSKLVKTRSFPGFLVNSYEPIECRLNGKLFVINPAEGSSVFISDWQSFVIPSDVIVVGIENAENFRFIRQQRDLFSAALPGKPLLFACRYPQEQSHDFRKWLLSMLNQYVHFGDLDLAGINIYQTEFYKHLGERASFLIPTDFESRIQQGSLERYTTQYRKFNNIEVQDTRLEPFVNCINKYHRCYDQEGFIRRVTKHYNVVCAVIVNDSCVLCMQRPWRGSESTAGKWEFPGGKIEEWKDENGVTRRELAEDALLRELREEMDYEVSIVKPLATVEHEYPDFSLSLQAFLCKAETRVFNRKEHIDHRWLKPEDLKTLDWAKADEELIEFLQKNI